MSKMAKKLKTSAWMLPVLDDASLQNVAGGVEGGHAVLCSSGKRVWKPPMEADRGIPKMRRS
jgi:hypothetical protein